MTVEFGADDDAAIEFHPGYWLTILAIRGGTDMNQNQSVDWSNVDRIKLMEIRQP